MENHPIPQDVTGFQFKLIGNMTVKQFAYLAIGLVLALVLFQLPVNFLIKFLLSSFSAILGISLAFLPISGRPMDLMMGNYIKALFRPTQFVYEKTGRNLYFSSNPALAAKAYKNTFSPLPTDKLKAYLENQELEKKNKIDEKENNFLKSVSNMPTPSLTMQPVAMPSQPKAVIKVMRNTGMPATPETPNLITGMIKDSRGNPLPNILVEVKDKGNNPVRAFKTNEVGRFASATPLLNGAYSMEFEDPKGQNRFETKTINATGQIILPVEVISIDTREELRRSLFTPKN